MPVKVTPSGDRLLADDQVKMKSVGCTLIQYDRVLRKKGTFGHRDRHAESKDKGKTEGECDLQAKESLRLPEARREA